MLPPVQTFNGCGFCKWARNNTNPKLSGYQNPGWPGCCRPPNPSENKLVQAADWPTVSLVHRVPIPSEIKAILESITGQRTSNALPFSTGSIRGSLPSSQPPSLSRRTSSSVTVPTRGDTTPNKVTPVSIPPKRSGSGGSPQQLSATLATGSRNAAADNISCSLPNASAMDQVQNMVRRPLVETQERRRNNSREAKKGSPNRQPVELLPSRKSVDATSSRKSIDLGSSARRNTTTQQRPSISAATTSTSVNKVTVDATTSYRSALAPSTNLPTASIPMPSSRTSGDREKSNTDSVRRRKTSLESALGGLSISSGSSASSSDSGGSTETTVISDGGFTDYLSDESDAELQRQAEIKAVLLEKMEQSYVEEQEFKAARQQLANIDLRPPKSWTSNVHSTPRSQNASSNNVGSAYNPHFYGSSSSSYIAATSSSHSRS
ncbi:hypothetical protein EIP86_001872 [Pleurotus ostreatoroseus]|nr:hypothetical protein EIP86_001872 [Pleurotus ostreatoroseus]